MISGFIATVSGLRKYAECTIIHDRGSGIFGGRDREIGCSGRMGMFNYFPRVLTEPLPAPRLVDLVGSLICKFCKIHGKIKGNLPILVND